MPALRYLDVRKRVDIEITTDASFVTEVNDLEFNGRYLYMLYSWNSYRVFDLRSKQIVFENSVPVVSLTDNPIVWGVTFDGRYLIFATSDDVLGDHLVWACPRTGALQKHVDLEVAVRSLCFNGKYILGLTEAGEIFRFSGNGDLTNQVTTLSVTSCRGITFSSKKLWVSDYNTATFRSTNSDGTISTSFTSPTDNPTWGLTCNERYLIYMSINNDEGEPTPPAPPG